MDAITGRDGTTSAAELLVFELGGESYCVSVDAVTEIVEAAELTVVPGASRHQQGVMDLRGTTTTIVDPKVSFGLEGDPGRRVIVFDPDLFDDERTVGWAVDDVRQVVDVHEAEVDDSPIEIAGIRGLVRRDGQFVIWVDPRQIAQ